MSATAARQKHRTPRAGFARHPATFAIHRDLDVVRLELVHPIGTGELRALIGVEDRRTAVFLNRFLQGANTKIGLQTVR